MNKLVAELDRLEKESAEKLSDMQVELIKVNQQIAKLMARKEKLVVDVRKQADKADTYRNLKAVASTLPEEEEQE